MNHIQFFTYANADTIEEMIYKMKPGKLKVINKTTTLNIVILRDLDIDLEPFIQKIINIKDVLKWTKSSPLGAITSHSKPAFLECLLNAGGDPNYIIDGERSLLFHLFVRSENDYNKRLIEILLDHGADPNISYHHHDWCNNVLGKALWLHNNDRFYIVKRFLEAGADPNIYCRPGIRPLDLCFNRFSDLKITFLVLQYGGTMHHDRLQTFLGLNVFIICDLMLYGPNTDWIQEIKGRIY